MAESISVIGGGHPVRRDENKKNNRLFVGSLDRTKTDVDVSRAMKELVDGVISVIMYPSPQEKTQNRGYAFVEFDSHENAVKAREYLRNNPPKLWGVSQIKVDWAEPENEVDAETMSKVKVLFVRQLAQSTSEEKLRKVFERFGALDRVKRQHDHAFIHFNEREHAAEALKQTNNTKLDGNVIEVQWSKPVTRDQQKLRRRDKPQQNFPMFTHAFLNTGHLQYLPPQLPTHLPVMQPHIEGHPLYSSHINNVNLYRGEPLMPAGPPGRFTNAVLQPPLGPHAFEAPQQQVSSAALTATSLLEDGPRTAHGPHQIGSAPGALRASIAPQVDTRPYPVPSMTQQHHQQQQQQQQQQLPLPLFSPPRTLSQAQLPFVGSPIPLHHSGAFAPYYANGLDLQHMGPFLAPGLPIQYLPYQEIPVSSYSEQ